MDDSTVASADAALDASTIRAAVSSTIVDNHSIIKLFAQRNSEQLYHMKVSYYSLFENHLDDDLINFANKKTKYHTTLMKLLKTRYRVYAELVDKALEQDRCELLIPLLLVIRAYEGEELCRYFGYDFSVDADTREARIQARKECESKSHRRMPSCEGNPAPMLMAQRIESMQHWGTSRALIVKLLSRGRPEHLPRSELDLTLISRDVSSIKGGFLTRDQFEDLVCARDPTHLTMLAQELGGVEQVPQSYRYRDEFERVVYCALFEERHSMFAQMFHEAFAPVLATNDSLLATMVSLLSPVELIRTKVAFEERYHRTLASCMYEETSGSYRELLLSRIAEWPLTTKPTPLASLQFTVGSIFGKK